NHIVLGNNRIAGSAIQMLSGDNGMGARTTLAVSAKQRAFGEDDRAIADFVVRSRVWVRGAIV
ncbi:MAG: hypothetical protein LH660_02215, partial [Phormidesmis sp. CAN_BIN36]|nr:hypothetical protein [Phormidesmis sp. CAN_BIN36]